ncbi:MAG: undecaprenyl-diphosphate phosphatase [Desulfobacterales bacterium]|nr:undecaprenyl-diphosphate phosphatase [Desulfobacterales bacterium]
MEIYQGITLGIVQGLTEFLPVSSSGHLVLGQALFGYTESQLVFSVSVHMGTLLAVLVVYSRDIGAVLRSLGVFISTLAARKPVSGLVKTDPDLRLAGMILFGSVPTALIGLVLKKFEHILFSSTLLVSLMLILTGTILWLSRKYYRTEGGTDRRYGMKEAGVVGIVQGLAVIPGISRSGSTIAAGMFMGMDRSTAAKFSFLLSIPAIIGAELVSIKELIETGGQLNMATLYATLAAFISGFFALKLLIGMVQSGKFHLFAPYCWFVGILVFMINIL